MIEYSVISDAIKILKEELIDDPQELTFDLIERALVEAIRENDPGFDYVLFLNDCEATIGQGVE
jgi:hypothetical protein